MSDAERDEEGGELSEEEGGGYRKMLAEKRRLEQALEGHEARKATAKQSKTSVPKAKEAEADSDDTVRIDEEDMAFSDDQEPPEPKGPERPWASLHAPDDQPTTEFGRSSAFSIHHPQNYSFRVPDERAEKKSSGQKGEDEDEYTRFVLAAFFRLVVKLCFRFLDNKTKPPPPPKMVYADGPDSLPLAKMELVKQPNNNLAIRVGTGFRPIYTVCK